jgi:hypothetical protein
LKKDDIMTYGKKTKAQGHQAQWRQAQSGPETSVNETEVSISEIRMGEISFCVLGTTPVVLNRLSEKAKQLLLLPKRKTNRAGLEQTLKHDPLQEYRDSVYQNKSPGAPTRILLHGGAFKRALADVALDIPGAAKATIGRLTSIKETMINLYGEPELMMAVVRQAGIVKSPDIRTRAVIRNWACKITVGYVSSVISREDVTNLLAASGIIIGVGGLAAPEGSWELRHVQALRSQGQGVERHRPDRGSPGPGRGPGQPQLLRRRHGGPGPVVLGRGQEEVG